jgi:hypothetical protein
MAGAGGGGGPERSLNKPQPYLRKGKGGPGGRP